MGPVFLPKDELYEAIHSPRRDRLFVGGQVLPKLRLVVLYRADWERYIFPFEDFTANVVAAPDFEDFGVTDGGNTVRLGPYEASADSLLGDPY